MLKGKYVACWFHFRGAKIVIYSYEDKRFSENDGYITFKKQAELLPTACFCF